MSETTKVRDMESAYEDFILSDEYDRAELLLSDCVRKAFIAGWRAAKAAPPTDNIVQLIK